MGALGAAATLTPPLKNGVYRYASGTTHATHAIPPAWKERYVTMFAETTTVHVLFGSVSAASNLSVDRTAAPANTTASTYGKPLDAAHASGYPFYITEYLTHFAIESAANGSVRVEVSSPDMGPVGTKSAVAGS
jgi:hypothetical protein